MTAISSIACLLALQGLPAVEEAAAHSSHTDTYLAAAALAGTAFASRKALRRALRKAAWQRLWHGRKGGFESPEFFWMGAILGVVGVIALLFGMGLLGSIALICAALLIVRSLY